MASQTQGIQQLLVAEKRAAEKVSEARKRKQKRLKKAKEEAQEEIEKYRRERERQFKEFEFKYMESRDGERIEIETATKLENMVRDIATTKNAVINELLSLVYDINPEVHKNFLCKMQN